MRAIIATAFAMLAVSAAAPAAAQYYDDDRYGGDVIRCESNDGRVHECATGGGRVVLERKHSRCACIEGRSWGYGRRGIWVSQGCRADFRVLGYGGGYGGGYNDGYDGDHHDGYGYGVTVRCESNDGRTNRCGISGRGRAQLVRQLSRAACIEGRTWGSDYNSVWVSDGCRGEFAASRGGYGGGWNNSGYGYGGQVFRCESTDGRTRECRANTRAGVQLVRQLSRAACIQGRSWGYGRNGIWVSDGCRAEFRTY